MFCIVRLTPTSVPRTPQQVLTRQAEKVDECSAPGSYTPPLLISPWSKFVTKTPQHSPTYPTKCVHVKLKSGGVFRPWELAVSNKALINPEGNYGMLKSWLDGVQKAAGADTRPLLSST
jgi:hypothetical protein